VCPYISLVGLAGSILGEFGYETQYNHSRKWRRLNQDMRPNEDAGTIDEVFRLHDLRWRSAEPTLFPQAGPTQFPS